MNHEKKLRNSAVWLLIAVMALSMLSVLSACKATEQDMHVPAEIMRNPETPLVYPGESFVPTPVPTVEPSPEPTPTPYYMSLYSNPYECYYDQLKKLLHGETLEYCNIMTQDATQMSIHRNNGEVSIVASWGSIYHGWGEKNDTPIFIFPNPDIWYDIFPPGEKLADSLVLSEDFGWYPLDSPSAKKPIYIPEYDQGADGYWRVIFGGDWMVVSLPWGQYEHLYRRFEGKYSDNSEWSDSPLAQYAHTCIFRTDDNWETWERWDSLEADAIAFHEVKGAHISPNGMGYITYSRWSVHYSGPSFGQGTPTYGIMLTRDGGKTWESVGDKIAHDLGLSDFTCCIFPAYFEGTHGLALMSYEGYKGLGYYGKVGIFVESYDGGESWIIREKKHDGEKGWYLDRGTANSDGK